MGRKPLSAFLIGSLTFLISHFAIAEGSVTLAWNASPDAEVTGYRLYYGVASGNYTNSAAVGNVTTATIANLTDGVTYYFAATAYDGVGGESDFSNEAVYTVPATNTSNNLPPTLAALSPVTLNEDAGAQTVTLAGIDDGDAAESQALSITATSSNPGLIPAPAISYANPDTTGTLTFTPAANGSGTSTITVTVNDGQSGNSTVTRSFVVTVNPVNDAPTLGAIAGVNLNEDASQQTVSLSGIGSGAANESQTLAVTTSSSNPGLIPNPTVTYSGGASGSLRFTPVANASGTATITVTVNDGQAANNTVSRTFDVTVNPVNDQPTLNNIANLNLPEDAPQQTVAMAGIGSGASNEAQALSVTATSSNPGLIPNPAIVYVSPNTTGSLTFTPTAGNSGTATITVIVNDGQAANNTVTRTFVVTVNAVNNPPTLNAISGVTVTEDAGQQTVSLTGIGTGAANETQTLTVTATSANTALIANPTIVYTSPNPTGTLRFTPASNASGSALITVTVNDGQALSNLVTRTVTVTVNPTNDAPTLNTIASTTLSENASQQTVALTGIGTGAANEIQTLTVTATSSNPSLIPTPTIVYSSPNATGSLRYQPVANANGTATITVTVNDGQSANNLVTRSFVVTVTEVNSAPTISALPNLAIVSKTNGVPVAFTIGDVETSPSALTLSAASSAPNLVALTNIVFGGSGSNRTVTVTPTRGTAGIADITIAVTDGQLSASRTFRVTVTAPPPEPGQLSLTKTPGGTVTPDLSTAELIVGQSYTVTATPSAGYLFTGWTGDISSTSPTITFVMTDSLALQANFVASPYPPVAGTYNGLFYEASEVRIPSAGGINVYLDAEGNYSAWLQIGSARHQFAGKLGLNLHSTNAITRSGANALTVELQAGSGASAGQVMGRVTDGVWSAPLSAGRAAPAADWAGEYTLSIPGLPGNASIPAGDGYATLHLAADGLGTLSGTLADGVQFSQSAYLTENGDWPLYVPVYGGKGALVSWFSFADLAASDVSGDLVWIKQAGSGTATYLAGFTNGTKVVGGKYVMPVDAAGKSLNLSAAVVTFSGGQFGAPFNNVVSVNAGNSVVNLSPNELTFRITKTTGTFSGQVRDPSDNQLYYFGGVVLQKGNVARGTTIGASQAGRVLLAAP